MTQLDENNFILPRLLSISSIFLSINNSESPDIGAKKILSLLEKYTPENQRFRKIIIIFMKTQGYGVDNCWFSICGPYLSFSALNIVIIGGGCFFLSIWKEKSNPLQLSQCLKHWMTDMVRKWKINNCRHHSLVFS